jgi:hypothetical protein
MTCADYRLLIPFRRTGDLLPQDAAGLDTHLATCPDCAALAVAGPADTALRRAFADVTIPAGLKDRVGRAVARERTGLLVRQVARFGLLVAILAVAGTIGLGLYGLTRPRLDTDSLAFWNGYEAESGQVQNLVYQWLSDEHLPTADLPFIMDFKYFASYGYERVGRAYVPVIKFQNQSAPAGSFAKLYFVRAGDVDARKAADAQSSFCTVRLFPGPNGLTYVLVHTGSDAAPFIRPAIPPGA